MQTTSKTRNAPLTVQCVECGKGKYQVGRSGTCCDETQATHTAPFKLGPDYNVPRVDGWLSSQVNAPTSPLFTPAMLAALLVDTEAAHKVYVDGIAADWDARIAGETSHAVRDYLTEERDSVIRRENGAWAQWYGAYMATRLDASAHAAQRQPTPTTDAPPYAPVAPTGAPFTRDESQDIAARRSALLDTPAYATVGKVGTDDDNASE